MKENVKNKELVRFLEDMKPKINIVDEIMGGGKTSWAIDFMNNSNFEKKFIYITPYLDEVKRIKDNVRSRIFYEPTTKNTSGSKMHDFEMLIRDGKDIVSTHALFKLIKHDLLQLIFLNGYTLILDEVINVTETMQITRHDYDTLVNQKLISIKEDGKIVWSEKHLDYEGKFSEYKQYALNDNLYLHSRSSGERHKLFVWTFPISIFKVFQEVYVLTYLFDGQLQKSYYDMFGVKYDYKSIELIDGKYTLVDYKGKGCEDRGNIKRLINIYDGNLNIIGENQHSLSSTWLKNNKNVNALGILQRNVSNYFKNITGTRGELNMWTTIKGEIDGDCSGKVFTKLKGKGYTNGFVPCNARATNEYSHKQSLAYLLNRFLNPLDKGFFQDKGIEVNETLWALSELLQWIWRSRIRKSENINLYIPSSRMRGILINYLNGVI